MPEETSEDKRKPKPKKQPFDHTQERYSDVQPIQDSSCVFEEMDRGEGMGVDDEKTYHRTEK